MKWKHTFVLLLLAALTGTLGAQTRRVQNKPYIDLRRFHYGFTIGVHDQSLKLQNNGYIDPATGQQWMAENDNHGLGFNVGVLGEWRLNPYLALRAIPSLYFGSKHIQFVEMGSGDIETQNMKSTYIGIPVDLKITAPRFNNYRPYVVAGIAPMYDLTRKRQENLLTQPFNLFVEVGLGCDLYLPFFKLIPELKFCFGLGNILEKNRNDLTDRNKLIFTQGVDRGTANMVVLSLYFE